MRQPGGLGDRGRGLCDKPAVCRAVFPERSFERRLFFAASEVRTPRLECREHFGVNGRLHVQRVLGRAARRVVESRAPEDLVRRGVDIRACVHDHRSVAAPHTERGRAALIAGEHVGRARRHDDEIGERHEFLSASFALLFVLRSKAQLLHRVARDAQSVERVMNETYELGAGAIGFRVRRQHDGVFVLSG